MNKQETKENSLTVDGSPYAPISLAKFIKNEAFTDREESKRNLTVIIDGSGNGLEADDPETVNVMIQDRIEQTKYFVEEIYPILQRVPAYLYRYIHWMMFDEEERKPYGSLKYPRDNDFIQALASGVLKETDPEYQQIHSFIKWAKNNTEATHLIGLLQLVGGSIRSASKQNSNVRIFIELPETGFHPKRERKLMMLLEKLKEEYGLKKDWTPT